MVLALIAPKFISNVEKSPGREKSSGREKSPGLFGAARSSQEVVDHLSKVHHVNSAGCCANGQDATYQPIGPRYVRYPLTQNTTSKTPKAASELAMVNRSPMPAPKKGAAELVEEDNAQDLYQVWPAP